jgi:hypothetical protein
MHFFFAQCVMCYRTAAAQQAARSQVLNSGILILLIPPTLVIGGILSLAFFRTRKVRRATPELSPPVVLR